MVEDGVPKAVVSALARFPRRGDVTVHVGGPQAVCLSFHPCL